MLARAGLEVDLGCRGRAGRRSRRPRNDRYLPASRCPRGVNVARGRARARRHDLVCFAVPAARCPAPSPRTPPQIPERAGVLVLSKGLVPPLGTLPSAYVAERTSAWAVGVLGGPAHRPRSTPAPQLVLAAARPPSQPGHRRADRRGFDATATADVVGVELAACAKDAAALAAAAAAHAGAERRRQRGRQGLRGGRGLRAPAARSPARFAGLAGAGDLVATVLSPGSAPPPASCSRGTANCSRCRCSPTASGPPAWRRRRGSPT